MHRHGDTTDVQRLYSTAGMYVCARLHSSSMLHCSLGMKMVTLVDERWESLMYPLLIQIRHHAECSRAHISTHTIHDVQQVLNWPYLANN